jgi:biopolymer transport protein ExbB
MVLNQMMSVITSVFRNRSACATRLGYKLCLSFLCLFAISTTGHAADSLVKHALSEQKQEHQHNTLREADFKATERQLRAQEAALKREKTSLQKEIDSLTVQFRQNEKSLADLEEKLRLETGSLGEVFGVVRQNAKTLQSDLSRSVTAVDRQKYTPVVDAIVQSKTLPSLKQLNGLWQSMDEQILASGEIKKVQIPYINSAGEKSVVPAVRIGAFGLINGHGYVAWDDAKRVAMPYLRQPAHTPTLNTITPLSTGQIQDIVFDPSKGTLLTQLANEPTLLDRIETGGAIGNIIIGLLVVGLLIAGFRGTSLARIKYKIKAQLKTPELPGNNPLGRILSVYDKEKHRSTTEALELRLLEVVVDEQSYLEKGLSMLKLLAALAPMLGLLGTVTGMIETFQVITQFGNGDPKIMASGISMALVTTVLGLVAAMPMLLAHNILSSQAETIRTILEKQGIGLVAEQAEKHCDAETTESAV